MLYHLSTNLSETIAIFDPRIPESENRMKGENNYIPRICVAKSIEDCLSAMPEGGYAMQSNNDPQRIRVYEFDENLVEEDNLLTAVDLYFSGWVLDAWVTGEYWVVNQSLRPLRVYDIELDSLRVFDAPFVKPNVFKKAYLRRGNPAEILDELEENATESVARVTNLTYKEVEEAVTV